MPIINDCWLIDWLSNKPRSRDRFVLLSGSRESLEMAIAIGYRATTTWRSSCRGFPSRAWRHSWTWDAMTSDGSTSRWFTTCATRWRRTAGQCTWWPLAPDSAAFCPDSGRFAPSLCHHAPRYIQLYFSICGRKKTNNRTIDNKKQLNNLLSSS